MAAVFHGGWGEVQCNIQLDLHSELTKQYYYDHVRDILLSYKNNWFGTSTKIKIKLAIGK